MPNIKMTVEAEGGHLHNLDIEFDYTIENDGIGSYEYWGFKGYDAGHNYIDEVNIVGIDLLKDVYVKDEDGNTRWEVVTRNIDLEKLTCVDLEKLEDIIAEEFDFEEYER